MKKILLSLVAIAFAINFSYAQWSTVGTITSTTNTIGISTTSPQASLDVNGQAFIRGKLPTTGLSMGSSGGNYSDISYNVTHTATTNSYNYTGGDVASMLRFDNGGFAFKGTVTSGTAGNPITFTDLMTVLSSGNVGIGTTSPSYKLVVEGSPGIVARFAGSSTQGLFVFSGQNLSGGSEPTLSTLTSSGNSGGPLAFGTGNDEAMRILNGGNVLINRTTQNNSAYKLDVNGYMHADKVVVNVGGADFVFAPTYKLNSLPALEKYIRANHHLPEIPSASEMKANGLSLGDSQIKLLQKVEELTLYMIEKDKQINTLQDEVNQLKQQVKTLLKPKK